jgi:hypothetical protein
MNTKRIFGALLTILGIAGLLFAAIAFVNNASITRDIRLLVTFEILGFVFFFSGISLARTKKGDTKSKKYASGN